MYENNGSLRQLLEIFHQSRKNGTHCKLFVETINGEQFCNIAVQIPAGPPTRKFTPATKKSQSTIRRDQDRLEKWRMKKKELAKTSTGSSTPSTGSSNPSSKSCNKDSASGLLSQTTMDSRRMVTPGRRLGSMEVEAAVWQPGPSVEQSPIPQVDGVGEDVCEHNLEFVQHTCDDDPSTETSFMCHDCKEDQWSWNSYACVRAPCKLKICEECIRKYQIFVTLKIHPTNLPPN